jgi:ATP-binding cassette, subfamily B, bacterial
MHDEIDVIKKIEVNAWKKLIDIVFKSKRALLKLIVLSMSIVLLDVLFPQLNRYAIDTFFIDKDLTTLTPFVIVSVVVAGLFGIVVWSFINVAIGIEGQVSYELRRQAFENIQTLSFSYFDKTPQGWVMARMTSDARRLSEVVSWGLLDFVWATFSMIAITIVLLITNFKLALVILVMIPIMLLISAFFRKKILFQEREARKHNSQVTAQFSESFLGAKTSKSLVIEQENFADFYQTTGKMRRSSIRSVMYSSMYSSILLIIAYAAISLTMVRGSVEVLNQMITLGTLQLFIAYTINFFEPVLIFSRLIADLQNAQASAERIVELIETPSELVDTKEVEMKYGTRFEPKHESWEPLKGDVEFREVSFYYKDNEMILQKFNLKVEAGKSVALVGHTGSGKTTIINLLSRFYEPKEGHILIDGKDYRERSIQWLHKRLGYVLQSPQLFSTTVMENIRYGRLDATDEEVIEASKAIGLHEFISTLDKGYATEVGEGGNFMSIGQKQLISFARAILANPRLLILDEATSSVDSESELIIQEATKRLLKDRTSFIVAHRLSTIVDADLILVLDMGEIKEMGNHQTLIEQRGKYFDLYKNQFFKEKEEKSILN